LHRLLAHAAVSWVFASLYTQPLEADVIRMLIKDRLALPGIPQMLLQLGLAHTTPATARRSPAALTEPGPPRADRLICHGCATSSLEQALSCKALVSSS